MLLWVSVLCLSLAAGCIQIRRTADVTREVLAEELFDRGVAELADTGDTTFFETLTREYPASPWAVRASAVTALLKAVDTGSRERTAAGEERVSGLQELNVRLKAELVRKVGELAGKQEELARKQDELARTQEKLASVRERFAEMHQERDRFEAENIELGKQVDHLRGEIARLQADLVQLKNLTIEMELRR